MATSPPHISKKTLYTTVFQCLPNACLFTAIPSHLQSEIFGTENVLQPHTSSLSSDMTTASRINPVSHKLITDHNGEQLDGSDVENASACARSPVESDMSSLPAPLSDLYKKEYEELDEAALGRLVNDTFLSISVNSHQSKLIERATRDQRNSLQWHAQRRGRLTASVFHEVLVRRRQSDADTLVKKFMSSRDISHVKAVQWGIEHEELARREYESQTNQQGHQIQLRCAGLVIDPRYPYLGASPDGFVRCSCASCDKADGLIEIKCPFSVKNGRPEDLFDKRGTYLKSGIGLVRTHKYYTQIQGQLEITKCKYCDFIVWTPNGLFTQRIYRNDKFISKLMKKLNSFFVESMLPELLTHRLQNSAASTQIECNTAMEFEESHTVTDGIYCLCRSGEDGDMIQCDNSECPYGWFHFHCIGLDCAPEAGLVVL